MRGRSLACSPSLPCFSPSHPVSQKEAWWSKCHLGQKADRREEGTVLFLRNFPAQSLPYPARPTHKLRPLRLASFPCRGCCCWRNVLCEEKAGNQGTGLFCTVMQTAPALLSLACGGLLSDPGSAGLLCLSWAVLGFQPAPGSLLRVIVLVPTLVTWEAVTERQSTNIRRSFSLMPTTHSCRSCLSNTGLPIPSITLHGVRSN